jgi:hypothetical protein
MDKIDEIFKSKWSKIVGWLMNLIFDLFELI